jgi:hypothetical protein
LMAFSHSCCGSEVFMLSKETGSASTI